MTDLDALESVARAVRELHVRRPFAPITDFLAHGQTDPPDQCDHCRCNWPCPTVQAAQTALDGGGDRG